MMTKLTDPAQIDRDALTKDWHGRKIYSYFRAYGLNYPFCQFYLLEYGDLRGYAMLLNATLLVSSADPLPPEELACFIAMHQPFRVETTPGVMQGLLETPGYQSLRRTLFELNAHGLPVDFQEADIDFSPRLDDVYAILHEGFPNLAAHAIWLTDTSHLIRNGISRPFTYKNMTTATILYDVDNQVLIGQVATKVAARGSGYARTFLSWLAAFLEQFHKRAVLFALDVRVSFYIEIGFTPIAEEYVLERLDKNKEAMQKGRLN